jgi:hypothetical protein
MTEEWGTGAGEHGTGGGPMEEEEDETHEL